MLSFFLINTQAEQSISWRTTRDVRRTTIFARRTMDGARRFSDDRQPRADD